MPRTYEDVQVARNEDRYSGEQEDHEQSIENCIREREVDTIKEVHNGG